MGPTNNITQEHTKFYLRSDVQYAPARQSGETSDPALVCGTSQRVAMAAEREMNAALQAPAFPLLTPLVVIEYERAFKSLGYIPRSDEARKLGLLVEYDPAEHFVSFVDPAEQYVPDAHGVMDVDPAGQ